MPTGKEPSIIQDQRASEPAFAGIAETQLKDSQKKAPGLQGLAVAKVFWRRKSRGTDRPNMAALRG